MHCFCEIQGASMKALQLRTKNTNRFSLMATAAPVLTLLTLLAFQADAADDSYPRPYAVPQPGTASQFGLVEASGLRWLHLSSRHGDLPVPTTSRQQTAAVVADLDKDGLNDFVL